MIIFLWIPIRNISCTFFVWFSFVQKHILTAQGISMSYCRHTQSTQKHSGTRKSPIALNSPIGSTNSIVLVNPSSSANQIVLTNLINSRPWLFSSTPFSPIRLPWRKKGNGIKATPLPPFTFSAKNFMNDLIHAGKSILTKKRCSAEKLLKITFLKKQKTDVRDIRFLWWR